MISLQQTEKRPVACCNEHDNLMREQKPGGAWVETCRICGRRHYGMDVDPLVVGVVAAPAQDSRAG